MQASPDRMVFRLLGASLLLVTIVDLSYGLDLFRIKSPIEKEYDQLNNRLVEYLGKINEKPEEHLDLVLTWLKEAQENGDKVKKTSIEAMLTFTSLLKLMDPVGSKCGIASMAIAMENEKACGTTLSRPREEIGQMRRIDLIVHLVTAQHAKYCQAKHPKRLLAAIQKLRGEPRERVEELVDLFDAVIDSVHMPNKEKLMKELTPIQFRKMAASAVNWKNKPELYAVLNHLLQTLDDEEAVFLMNVRLGPDSQPHKVPVNEDNVKIILENHLFQNCKDFLGHFYQVVTPAMYHERFFAEDFKHKSLSAAEEKVIMYGQYYSMCQQLYQDKIQAYVEKTIIQAIKDGPTS